MQPPPFWSLHATEVLKNLQSQPDGITDAEALDRLSRYGPNSLKPKKQRTSLKLLIEQFKSPIILILVFAAGLSFAIQSATEATVILAIVLASGLLGFWQERGAVDAVEKLLATVQIKATVRRGGIEKEIPLEATVPGDLVILKTGDGIPGDCLILESKDLYVEEATLTGETYPAEKTAGVLRVETPLGQRTNSLWMGTHVVSGSAVALVVNTGRATEFGHVYERLRLRSPETEFERGIMSFGHLLLHVTLILVIAVFAINVYLARPVLESFLFSIALAVGLTPQLLPAIMSVNLAQGARRMAGVKVIVKRLASIENFGSMNILCSDKTGTLTEGAVRLESALDHEGKASDVVLLYGCLNATFQTGFTNPIDEALRNKKEIELSAYRKLDEVPYDFIRKRLSVLVSGEGTTLMVTKGALGNILAGCINARTAEMATVDIGSVNEKVHQLFTQFSNSGYRTIGVAYKDLKGKETITKAEEYGMTFLGFLLFSDPPKSGVKETLAHFKRLGVSMKLITGDNELVAQNASQRVGIPFPEILSGEDLHGLSDEALRVLAPDVDVFAGVDPNQKERIIQALRKSGNVVGYMGDGINDAPALHAADVSISVNNAVDVAKEAADFVLLERSLDVLLQGIEEGRKTFANTIKYISYTVSANFGNMISMAAVSPFLPFLPLLPKQILLNNFLTDFPAMTIATDAVDSEMVTRPKRWNITFIRNFMIVYGLLSSVFDILTFGLLLWVLKLNADQFRTSWFIESVLTELLVFLVIRTFRPFFRSRPGDLLWVSTLVVAVTSLILPYLPFVQNVFGFVALSPFLMILLLAITGLYVISNEGAKRVFYRWISY
jgi:Mg2+-importing ATPase